MCRQCVSQHIAILWHVMSSLRHCNFWQIVTIHMLTLAFFSLFLCFNSGQSGIVVPSLHFAAVLLFLAASGSLSDQINLLTEVTLRNKYRRRHLFTSTWLSLQYFKKQKRFWPSRACVACPLIPSNWPCITANDPFSTQFSNSSRYLRLWLKQVVLSTDSTEADMKCREHNIWLRWDTAGCLVSNRVDFSSRRHYNIWQYKNRYIVLAVNGVLVQYTFTPRLFAICFLWIRLFTFFEYFFSNSSESPRCRQILGYSESCDCCQVSILKDTSRLL